MLVVGHRGAMGHAPENTLASFQKALELEVDWVELDVYVVEDRLIVIHDHTLDRTTNGSGPIEAHSLTELRALDAGNGQQIPFLEEVFDLIDRQVGINVELKGPGTAAPAVAFLEKKIAAGWPLEKLLLSSFAHAQLLEARRLKPDIPRAPLYYGRPPDFNFAINELAAVAVNPFYKDVNEALVAAAHDRGLAVWTYTVNEAEDINRMRALGVDAVFTNYPDRVVD